MSSICMERRDRNQVVVEARRIETMGGMIRDLLARGGRIWDNPSLKGDHGQSKCQALQPIRVFGTDRGRGKVWARQCGELVKADHSRNKAPNGLLPQHVSMGGMMIMEVR